MRMRTWIPTLEEAARLRDFLEPYIGPGHNMGPIFEAAYSCKSYSALQATFQHALAQRENAGKKAPRSVKWFAGIARRAWGRTPPKGPRRASEALDRRLSQKIDDWDNLPEDIRRLHRKLSGYF